AVLISPTPQRRGNAGRLTAISFITPCTGAHFAASSRRRSPSRCGRAGDLQYPQRRIGLPAKTVHAENPAIPTPTPFLRLHGAESRPENCHCGTVPEIYLSA